MKRALLLLAPLLLGNRQEALFRAEGARYLIESTADRRHALEVLRHMDLCYDAYRRFLNPPAERRPREKLTLVLYRDLEEYRARGGAGRYGHYDGRQLVGYVDPEQMLPTFAHEGMHQFTDICVPGYDRLPPWYVEGIAECIANNEVRGGRLFTCLRNGAVPRLRVPAVREALRGGGLVPLRELLATDKRRFQERHALFYAQSWLFCHFLLTYPRLEDPTRQIPEGRYKPVLVRFHNAMADPKARAADALRQSLILDGRALDLDDLDREFREYALAFDAAR